MELIPLQADLATRIAAGDTAALGPASNLGAILPTLQAVAAALAEMYRRTDAANPWIGYLARDEASGALVGTAGFKDACRNGSVEIAYFTFPGFENQGWAGRMAAALVSIAQREVENLQIVAHTLPEENASTRILRRLGFRMTGPVQDPDDGPVWRWTLTQLDASAGQCTS